ncbi:MAG TPA: shikimate kinase [Pyrinomonadaceae bacterium]|jgi:shikimate kinase|nr:shikimate kinase [Pyrinomonadaceae bacterium]
MAVEFNKRIALTGFMGVGKSSVARHLAHSLRCERTDLDNVIEEAENRSIADIINTDGEVRYREIETSNLESVIADKTVRILSLGGGTWTVEENREMLKKSGFISVWLESSFEHCWMNIKFSHKVRPLAKNKRNARKLFEERQKIYCLADWHFIVKPEFTSFDVASRILEELIS